MALRGNTALPAFGLGHGHAAAEALRPSGGGTRMILSRVTAAFARGLNAAAMLQRLSSADDQLFRDVGLNRSLIERPEYRLMRQDR